LVLSCIYLCFLPHAPVARCLPPLRPSTLSSLGQRPVSSGRQADSSLLPYQVSLRVVGLRSTGSPTSSSPPPYPKYFPTSFPLCLAFLSFPPHPTSILTSSFNLRNSSLGCRRESWVLRSCYSFSLLFRFIFFTRYSSILLTTPSHLLAPGKHDFAS
jgi:hypothetical protein